MAPERTPQEQGKAAALLARFARGELLGLLGREQAERGYLLYRESRIQRLGWGGDALEGVFAGPPGTVTVVERPTEVRLDCRCDACGTPTSPCAHAVAVLLQWLDVRPTMLRLGPGAIWRSRSRHPFIAPSRSATDRIDLGHLTGVDLRSALELQLSLQHRSGAAAARLLDHEVEVRITLPSGGERAVFFSAAVLPSALPLLRSLPRLALEGELAELELSETRLHPVLTASWTDEGIILEPGYRVTDGTVIPAAELDGRAYGRWARIGRQLCLLLDPATPLVPFHRRGRQVLTGREALRFLNLDHPQLVQQPWYRPQGYLAAFRQPLLPRASALEADVDGDDVVIRPRFTAGDVELSWAEAVKVLDQGFVRAGGAILQAPDLHPFTSAGFKLPPRKVARGLVGDRLAFIRLTADTGLPVVGGDERLRELARVLQGGTAAAVGEIPGLRSKLRPYQHDGVAWLWSRYLAGVGALLADDMGLGKTHQVMGLLCLIRQRLPEAQVLVVCPRGVLEHWQDLLATFAPELPRHVYHGPGRSLGNGSQAQGLILTTYDILVRSADQLCERPWHVAVFDEAQRIKNPRTKAARAARRVEATYRVALSGTPMENRLLELWSVIDLILPGYLGSEREFRTAFRGPTHHDLHALRRRLSVLTLRRLKEQVLSELPDKVEDLRYCRLAPEQEELYRTIHSQRAAEIAALLADPSAQIPYMHIFALMTRLKQVCDHPSLVGEVGSNTPSGKLEVFDQILDEALAAEHRVVVFSQYVQMIELLRKYLNARRIRVLTLTGDTRDRGRLVRRFNSGQHERVLLASLLAGGVGIDLTGASVVIHYDRWWNPAKENQATDRVHRIGQKRFVQVFKLITRDTIEERIDRIILDKVKLLEEVVTPTEEVLRGLSRAQLAELLGLELEGASR